MTGDDTCDFCDEAAYVILEGTPEDYPVCKLHFNSAEDQDLVVRYVDEEVSR